jgi:hypothetical protein
MKIIHMKTSHHNNYETLFRFGGSGRDYNATSAIHVEGVPPKMTGVSVLYSAYNGINITMPDAPVTLNQCTMKWNRGKFAGGIIQVFFTE